MAGQDINAERAKAASLCTTSGLPQELHGKQPRIVWSVAGFDPSSGAGVTADLLTFASHGLFGCSAITALTVQSTTGVFGWEGLSTPLLRDTLKRLGEDLPARGIKIGMLGSAEAALVVAEFLKGITGPRPIVVLDPVLRSSSGRELFPATGMDAFKTGLLPHADWITPNWMELAALSGLEVARAEDAAAAAERVGEAFPGLHIVATGGDQQYPEDNLRLPNGRMVRFDGERVETTSTHGTGCAFSSALLSELVLGAQAEDAVWRAKRFVEGALRRAPGLGNGRGPLDLLWPLRGDTGKTG